MTTPDRCSQSTAGTISIKGGVVTIAVPATEQTGQKWESIDCEFRSRQQQARKQRRQKKAAFRSVTHFGHFKAGFILYPGSP